MPALEDLIHQPNQEDSRWKAKSISKSRRPVAMEEVVVLLRSCRSDSARLVEQCCMGLLPMRKT